MALAESRNELVARLEANTLESAWSKCDQALCRLAKLVDGPVQDYATALRELRRRATERGKSWSHLHSQDYILESSVVFHFLITCIIIQTDNSQMQVEARIGKMDQNRPPHISLDLLERLRHYMRLFTTSQEDKVILLWGICYKSILIHQRCRIGMRF